MIRAILILIVVAITLTAGYLVLDLRKAENSDSIKVGYLAISATTPLFVGIEEGIFDKYGLDLELVEFRTSNEIVAAAAVGRIDFIGIAATNAAIDAMNETGSQFQLFLVNAYVKRPDLQSSDFLIGQPGVDSFEALRGKTIAFMPGSIGRVFAEEIFPANGITIDEIDYVEMSPPQWLPAFRAGQIDAVTALEPFGTMIMENTDFSMIVDGYYAEVLPRVPVSGAWFIADALTKEQESSFVAAYAEILKRIESDRNIATSSLAKYTNFPPEIINRIRLNEWYLINDDDSRKSANDFAILFARNGGIGSLPQEGWLWAEE